MKVWIYVFVHVFALLLEYVCPGFTVVRTVSSSEVENNRYFLLNRGSAKEILDNNTISSLGFDISSITNISYSLINSFRREGIAPSIVLGKVEPDECMRFEILKITTLQVNLLYGLEKIGEYINPAIIPWQGRYLLGCGLAWGYITGKAANEHLEFQWLNLSSAPFYSNERHLGISGTIDVIDNVIVGQDPRFTVIDANRVFVAFTNRFGRQIRMGMAEIFINSSNIATVVNIHNTIIPPGDHNRHSQKNWSPFLYNNTVLMIQRINPLHVVGLENYTTDINYNDIHSYTFSQAPLLPLNWNHGDIRGGTNALLVGDVYLALFHSDSHANGNWLKTYWMGAYTFTAQPPFRLVAISPFPIVTKSLYDGPWDPLKNRRIDFCIFPMSISLVNDGDEILLSFGRQDHEGWIAYMNLQSVLDSLDPVPSPSRRR